MASLLGKLLTDKNDRWLFAGMVIIAANAGGAWSPIGDVTTTMLWIGNQVTTTNLVFGIIIPSIVCTIIPMFILSRSIKGEYERKPAKTRIARPKPCVGHHSFAMNISACAYPNAKQKSYGYMCGAIACIGRRQGEV